MELTNPEFRQSLFAAVVAVMRDEHQGLIRKYAEMRLENPSSLIKDLHGEISHSIAINTK
jgi:hypothetical protein